EKDITPELRESKVVLTNTQRLYGPNVADHAMALLLSLTRGLAQGSKAITGQANGRTLWDAHKVSSRPDELRGKTMLVVGLGGIGTDVARRASGFGMRVLAVDPNEKIRKPPFVFSIRRPAELLVLLPYVDVVVV